MSAYLTVAEVGEQTGIVANPGQRQSAEVEGKKPLCRGPGVGCLQGFLRLGVANGLFKIADLEIKDFPDLVADRGILRADLDSQAEDGATKDATVLTAARHLRLADVVKIVGDPLQGRHRR